MLRKAHDLIGFTLEATDGDLGRIDDFYFDDESWKIRYLVVDVGPWLVGRKVLITPDALARPRWELNRLPIQLTKEQIENSPETDFDKPVSRQHEIAIYTHYGWSPYWMPFAAPIGAAGIAPVGATTVAPGAGAVSSASDAPYTDDLQQARATAEREGDPNLRSIKEVTGYYIQATDGDIGHVEDFFVDETSWDIRYLLIDTQNWWPGKRVLVAPDWIERISWQESKVFVDLTFEEVKQSPEYDPSVPLERRYESSLYEYYGVPGYWI